MNPYDISSTFKDRAEAIRELSAQVHWRQKFTALGRMDRAGKEERERLDNWLSGEPAFSNEKLAWVISIVLPVMSVAMLLMGIVKLLPYSLFIITFLVNLGVLSLYLKRINGVHSLVSRQYNSLITIKSLIEHITANQFESGYLLDIKRNMTERQVKAIATIDDLAGIIKGFDVRLNMIMGVILNGILLWDIWSVLRLEKWKRSVKVFIPGWFDDLARADALVSLANYAFNNPGFIYPVDSEGDIPVMAEGMGHPLIRRDVRVVNDFTIGHTGEIVIITGANMAGKSTFLRTVAVNLVLAMAGAPVCAMRFSFSPLSIFSSMRTSDSLSENESYFYAELKRLKRLKERIEKGEKLFFILDEILKGTNSKDKSEGSRLFIEKIISYNATGIIATHDTSLGDLELSHPGTVRNLCFEISIEGDTVSFDYLLHPGITTRMNAAILMRQQGIID
ncbi:MAG: DNA mismatch repair protein MutS [Bacteroidales bacterium]